MLLIAAGLTLRSLMNVQNVDPGIPHREPAHVARRHELRQVPADDAAARSARAKMAAYWTEYEQRLRAIPGVMEVGRRRHLPAERDRSVPAGAGPRRPSAAAGRQPPQIDVRFATPDYFKTLGQPIVDGRAFAPSDTLTRPGVAIVNQSAAKQFWPNEDPVGTRIAGGGPEPVAAPSSASSPTCGSSSIGRRSRGLRAGARRPSTSARHGSCTRSCRSRT